jgi:hypothetical protein
MCWGAGLRSFQVPRLERPKSEAGLRGVQMRSYKSKRPTWSLSGFLRFSRPVIWCGLFIGIRGRHFRQTTIPGELGRSIDLLIGHFRIRVHERPLMECTGLNQPFQRLLAPFNQRESAIGRKWAYSEASTVRCR